MARWNYPLDPECPAVAKFEESLDDPIMQESGCAGEFYEDWSKKHRRDCTRCQEYGAANVEIADG